ncbi:MAG TPA: hypothetical protein VFI47_29745 [Acidimicrobiales bacterium]|nr:hypothetical protein [Acidimicrobiales bacterium]
MRLTAPASLALVAATLVGGTTGALLLGPAGAGTGAATAAPADDRPTAGTCRAPLAPIAADIGITVDDLRAALREGSTLAEVAAANGVEAQVVVDGIVTRGTARIDAAVAAGQIDAATGDARKAKLPEVAADLVEGGLERRPRHLAALRTVAETIGIPVADLRAALRDGQSIAEVAEAHGVEPQAVVDALVARSTRRITRVVEGEPRRPGC